MLQVVDLHSDRKFQQLDIELLSISPDPLDAWREGIEEYDIESPVLSDEGNRVAEDYGVMQWMAPSGEPGHTFVLVDEAGIIRWVRDYGAPQNGGLMYVLPEELMKELVPVVSRS
jgi:peroxiredoxin